MYYHTIENEQIVTHSVETFPPEVEAIYADVRQRYTICYSLSDWADDDTDAGWGYDYDNSYTVYREPQRHELLLKDNAFYGFYVGFSTYYASCGKEVLIPQIDESIYQDSYSTKRYRDSKSWELITEPSPAPCDHLFLLDYPHENRDNVITAADLKSDDIAEVVWKRFIQNHRGHFDGASRLLCRLTPKGIAHPDEVLKNFSRYGAYLARNK